MPKKPSPPAGKPTTLTPARRAFALAYLANGFNGTQAYLDTHPGCSTRGAARATAAQTLAIPSVKAFLAPLLEAHWKKLQVGGEEALARIGRDATYDVRDLYTEHGTFKPPADWPDSIAGSIKAVEFEDGVPCKVTLVDGLAARRLILEQTGKLKTIGGGLDELADAIRADVARHTGKPA